MTKNKRKGKGSLFRRYFGLSVITVMLGFMFLGFLMMLFIASRWWDDKAVTLVRNVRNISAAYVEIYQEGHNIPEDIGDDEILNDALRIMSQATLSDYFITDLKGKVINCGDCEGGSSLECAYHKTLTVSKAHMERAMDGGFSDYTTEDEFGTGRFVVAIPIRVNGEIQAVAFAVEDAITGLLPYIASISTSFFYSLIIALIIVFIAIYYITKGITKPLSEMQEITEHFAKGDFEHKADEKYKKRQFSDFAKALNKMAHELKLTEESRKSFVANVSHELKTPMTSIGGFIDGMLDGTIPPEEEKKYLTIVSNEVKRLSRMVVSMLNLSKIEAGEIELSPVRYNVTKQIFEILLSFEKKIDEKKIEIEGFEALGSVSIRADRDLIQQVIYNLIDNAVKFTPEKGTIAFFADNDGKSTVVTIRNSGPGVSEEEISRIFERFYKVDKSRSYDIKGVGLGLYIVKTVINMHDGDIRAGSKQGEYTEFTFEIPYSE